MGSELGNMPWIRIRGNNSLYVRKSESILRNIVCGLTSAHLPLTLQSLIPMRYCTPVACAVGRRRMARAQGKFLVVAQERRREWMREVEGSDTQERTRTACWRKPILAILRMYSSCCVNETLSPPLLRDDNAPNMAKRIKKLVIDHQT